jgi:hypothetical protein
MGAGKGWAKGLTKAIDSRVARMAEAHRGTLYVRRTPRALCAWPVAGHTTLELAWSSEMAYIVGLMATDGCLYSGRRKLNFKSRDRVLVTTFLRILGRTNRVKEAPTEDGGIVYFTEFSDSFLYEWFRSVGLTPRKSLTLGALAVPDKYLLPLARGLLDGDGSVINETYRADTRARSDYYWEYLITSFVSASRAHLDWLEGRITSVIGVRGCVAEAKRRIPDPKRHSVFQLRYGKRASQVLLPILYPEGAPCLERKRAIWSRYAVRHDIQVS